MDRAQKGAIHLIYPRHSGDSLAKKIEDYFAGLLYTMGAPAPTLADEVEIGVIRSCYVWAELYRKSCHLCYSPSQHTVGYSRKGEGGEDLYACEPLHHVNEVKIDTNHLC